MAPLENAVAGYQLYSDVGERTEASEVRCHHEIEKMTRTVLSITRVFVSKRTQTG